MSLSNASNKQTPSTAEKVVDTSIHTTDSPAAKASKPTPIHTPGSPADKASKPTLIHTKTKETKKERLARLTLESANIDSSLTPMGSVSEFKEDSPKKDSPKEDSPKEDSPEAAPTKVVPLKADSPEAAPPEAAPTKVAPTEVAPTEVAPTEAAPTEVAPTEADSPEAAPTEAAPTKVAPTKVAPTKVDSTKVAPTKEDSIKAEELAMKLINAQKKIGDLQGKQKVNQDNLSEVAETTEKLFLQLECCEKMKKQLEQEKKNLGDQLAGQIATRDSISHDTPGLLNALASLAISAPVASTASVVASSTVSSQENITWPLPSKGGETPRKKPTLIQNLISSESVSVPISTQKKLALTHLFSQELGPVSDDTGSSSEDKYIPTPHGVKVHRTYLSDGSQQESVTCYCVIRTRGSSPSQSLCDCSPNGREFHSLQDWAEHHPTITPELQPGLFDICQVSGCSKHVAASRSGVRDHMIHHHSRETKDYLLQHGIKDDEKSWWVHAFQLLSPKNELLSSKNRVWVGNSTILVDFNKTKVVETDYTRSALRPDNSVSGGKFNVEDVDGHTVHTYFKGDRLHGQLCPQEGQFVLKQSGLKPLRCSRKDCQAPCHIQGRLKWLQESQQALPQGGYPQQDGGFRQQGGLRQQGGYPQQGGFPRQQGGYPQQGNHSQPDMNTTTRLFGRTLTQTDVENFMGASMSDK